MESTQTRIDEQKIIDIIIPKECQEFLQKYCIKDLFGEDKVFTKGLTPQDYDIILSTSEAEDTDIFHSLYICNTKFDPETAPSRKVIIFEDLETIMIPFIDYQKEAEKYFNEAAISVYPKIRRNLRFDITSLNYKIVKNEEGGKIVLQDYKMEHKDNNPDNKDILCICTFKLDGKDHKYGKIIQLLEQFNEFPAFFDDHRIAYIIFCVENEEMILNGYEKFPDKMKTCNEKYENVRLIFYLKPSGEDNKEILNMYAYNDIGKNYYFHMNSNHVIYRADNMLCSGDIIENSIKRKKKEKEENEKNKKLNKTQEQLINERNEAFFTFYNFLKNIKDYKYALYMNFQFEICLRFNEENKLTINYIDFSLIIAELRNREYNIIKKCAEILNPDFLDIEEIPTIDIDIDFTDNKCNKCNKNIQDNEAMYYCYKCKIKYCRNCVKANFYSKVGKAKFIDEKHNILYFKTRDIQRFKNIDRHKLGNDLFASCNEDKKLVDHSATCNGCKNGIKKSPRYLCLNCRPGKIYEDGYIDYCDDCVEHMMKGDEEGKEIQLSEQQLYNEQTRLLHGANETYRHENDNHVYLMIALQYNNNEDPYYNF